jgi:hypothetical protein
LIPALGTPEKCHSSEPEDTLRSTLRIGSSSPISVLFTAIPAAEAKFQSSLRPVEASLEERNRLRYAGERRSVRAWVAHPHAKAITAQERHKRSDPQGLWHCATIATEKAWRRERAARRMRLWVSLVNRRTGY